MGEILLDAAFAAPLIAVDPDSPHLLHAATMEEVIHVWPDGPITSACGVEGLLLVGNGGRSVAWPPRVASLLPHMSRCKKCHDLTGKKRPRSQFKANADA